MLHAAAALLQRCDEIGVASLERVPGSEQCWATAFRGLGIDLVGREARQGHGEAAGEPTDGRLRAVVQAVDHETHVRAVAFAVDAVQVLDGITLAFQVDRGESLAREVIDVAGEIAGLPIGPWVRLGCRPGRGRIPAPCERAFERRSQLVIELGFEPCCQHGELVFGTVVVGDLARRAIPAERTSRVGRPVVGGLRSVREAEPQVAGHRLHGRDAIVEPARATDELGARARRLRTRPQRAREPLAASPVGVVTPEEPEPAFVVELSLRPRIGENGCHGAAECATGGRARIADSRGVGAYARAA